jgi:hypothetical protein
MNVRAEINIHVSVSDRCTNATIGSLSFARGHIGLIESASVVDAGNDTVDINIPGASFTPRLGAASKLTDVAIWLGVEEISVFGIYTDKDLMIYGCRVCCDVTDINGHPRRICVSCPGNCDLCSC